MKTHIAVLLTMIFMVGIMINHIAVTKLILGMDVVWIYDLSLVWVMALFFIAIPKNEGVKKCH